jgi:hypothetical protein
LNLFAVIRALRGAVAGWGLLGSALILLLHRRLGGICGQMERLSQRFLAGRLWRRGARLAAGARAAADCGPGSVASLTFPYRFGWLVRLMAYRAAVYGGQLREILGQPEMVELLIAAPQAARILRPLCRMLAVETSLLRPGLAVVAAVGPEAQAPGEVVPVVKVRVRRPRAVVDWGRIPLPRGVLSAARRQGFGKGG